MKLTYFCPTCWSESGEATTCANCGADLRDLSAKSYEEKLILALHHPEPTVPVRAAAILGELRSHAAVESLLDLARDSLDPYIQEAAADALRQIGDECVLPCLFRLSQNGAVRVRVAAKNAIKAIKERQHDRKH